MPRFLFSAFIKNAMPPTKPPRGQKKSAVKKCHTKTKTVVKNQWADIDVQALLKNFEESILGDGTLTPAQVTVALALLKKALPDVAGDETPGLTHEEALKQLDTE